MVVFLILFVLTLAGLVGIVAACRGTDEAARVLDETDVSDLYGGPR